MSQFYAEIRGNRGPASRTGSKSSGMSSHTRGWHVGCRVECRYDEKTGTDIIYVYRTSGSSGNKHDVLIAKLYENDEVAFNKEAEAQYGIKLERDPSPT